MQYDAALGGGASWLLSHSNIYSSEKLISKCKSRVMPAEFGVRECRYGLSAKTRLFRPYLNISARYPDAASAADVPTLAWLEQRRVQPEATRASVHAAKTASAVVAPSTAEERVLDEGL